MSSNFTDEFERVYTVATTGVTVIVSTLLVLPSLILCLVCVLALIFTTITSAKIRILLMNMFAAEICHWFAYIVFYFGFSARLSNLMPGETSYSCQFFYSALSVSRVQKFTAGAVYAAVVYNILKYGEDKLKWKVIAPLIIVSWVVVIVGCGSIPYTNLVMIASNHGICRVAFTAVIDGVVAFFLFIALTCSAVTIFFCILVSLHIKKNIPNTDDVKKGIAKILFFNTIATILTFIASVGPTISVFTIGKLFENEADVIVTNLIIQIVLSLLPIATPVVIIAFFKTLRIGIETFILLFPKYLI